MVVLLTDFLKGNVENWKVTVDGSINTAKKEVEWLHENQKAAKAVKPVILRAPTEGSTNKRCFFAKHFNQACPSMQMFC